MDRIEWIISHYPGAEKAAELYRFYDEYVEEYGDITFETYKRYCREAVKSNEVEVTDSPVLMKSSITDDKRETVIIYSKIMTVEDLAKVSNIDLNIWEPKEIINGRWTDNNFQIKVIWRRKNPHTMSVSDYAKRFNELVYMDKSIYTIKKREVKHSGKMAQIALFDFHFGQLSWDKETNDGNYNIEIAAELMDQTVDYFIEK